VEDGASDAKGQGLPMQHKSTDQVVEAESEAHAKDCALDNAQESTTAVEVDGSDQTERSPAAEDDSEPLLAADDVSSAAGEEEKSEATTVSMPAKIVQDISMVSTTEAEIGSPPHQGSRQTSSSTEKQQSSDLRVRRQSSLLREDSTDSNDPIVTKEFEVTNIEIDVVDCCPSCGHMIREADVCKGWQPDENEYTSRCSNCARKFVATFQVHLSGTTQGQLETVRCEAFSPVVVQKEVDNLVRGIEGIGEKEPGTFVKYLRARQPSIFWNIVWHFLLCKLPVHFLFHGENAQVRRRPAPSSGLPSVKDIFAMAGM